MLLFFYLYGWFTYEEHVCPIFSENNNNKKLSLLFVIVFLCIYYSIFVGCFEKERARENSRHTQSPRTKTNLPFFSGNTQKKVL